MTFFGLLFCFPLLGIVEFFQGNFGFILFTIINSPYWIVGAALLINVVLSFHAKKPDENSDNGDAFF